MELKTAKGLRVKVAVALTALVSGLTLGISPASAADLDLAPDLLTASPTVFTDGDIAVDSSGRLFVASKRNSPAGNVRIYANPSSGTATTTITGLDAPDGIAVFPDGSGIFIAEDNGGKVSFYYENGASYTAGTSITGLSRPVGTWVNGSNLYVALYGGNEVRQYTISGTGAGLTLTLAKTFTGLNGPYGITVDSAGTLYVSEVFQARIKVFTAATISACGATCAITPDRTISGAATLLSGPWFMETDGDNRLYVSNFYDTSILIFDAGAAGNTAPLVRVKGAATLLTSNTGMAVDSDWNFYSQNANSTGCSPLTAGCVQRWMRFPAQFTPSSPGGDSEVPVYEVNLVDGQGGRCPSTSVSGSVGSWLVLPDAKSCTPPTGRAQSTLLGWATTPNFPLDIAKRQVANGWGAYEIFDTNGQVSAVFIPAGGATLISSPGGLHAIWS